MGHQMDANKLQQLREQFGEAQGGDIFDPEFRRVADLQFVGSDKRRWPFMDVATFASAPYTFATRRAFSSAASE